MTKYYQKEDCRVLPFDKIALITSVYEQLKLGTTFSCEPLAEYVNCPGIRFMTRREIG